MARVLRNLKINEVSGVDRGAGHGVKIMLMKRAEEKREFSDKEREHLADTGAAMSGGGFPIKTVQDLKNAIQAIGRAKNPAAAKAHIKTRARALGASDLIPDTWKRDDALEALNKSLASILSGDGAVDKLDDTFAAFKAHISGENEMTADEIKKAIADGIAAEMKKANDEIAKRDEQIVVLKMSAEHKAFYDRMEDGDAKKKFASASAEERDKMCNKRDADPVAAEIAKRDDRIADLEKQLGGLLRDRQVVEFAKRAVDAGLTEADGEVMRKAYGGDVEAQTALNKRFADVTKALRDQVKTGSLFKEFGTAAAGGTGVSAAYDQLQQKAAELRKADPKLTPEQAFTKVYTDPANRELALQDKQDQANRLAKIAAATQ